MTSDYLRSMAVWLAGAFTCAMLTAASGFFVWGT
jgi:hypothetical protein